MSIEAITSTELSPPSAPLSLATRVGDLIFVSGQVALSLATGELIEGDVTAQTEQVFKNLQAVLRAAGKTLADVARVNVYLADMKDYARMNAVYERHFKAPYPARTAVAVAALPLGASVEIDLIAR